jgi:hypothetical protein
MRGPLITLWLLTGLAGCSVSEALEGKNQGDPPKIEIGDTRESVEQQIGKPIRKFSDNDRLLVYAYEAPTPPSDGRAAMHGALDVVTLGFWELAGTPFEARPGDTIQVTVLYDDNDRVAKVTARKLGY